MGILRADLLTHSQLESAGGSVVFDGSGDYLTIPNHSAFHFTGDYTIDFYIKFSTNSGTQRIFGQRNSDASDLSVLGEFASNNFYYYYSQNGTNSENIIIGSSGSSDETKNLELNTWYHVAIVSDGGVHHSYLNGVQTAVNVNNSPPLKNASSTWSIGRQGAFTSNEFSGSIYGFRITQGALYKDNFTVSKFKPKVLSGTVLLCCVSSTSVTEAEVSVAGDITSNGDPQIGDTPLLKEDITDTGVVFDGFTVLATSTYMVPPSGKTTERNRGRAVFGGGQSTTLTSAIHVFNIQSQGNTVEVGQLSQSNWGLGACGSSTRGLFGGGRTAPGGSGTYLNTIEFVTIANAGNSSDFGDLTRAGSYINSLGNQTRGIWGGAYNVDTKPATNVGSNTIDYVTIASTGNAADFGDLVRQSGSSDTTFSKFTTASSTRGLFAGGYGAPSGEIDEITYITIATTGNTTYFGDLTAANAFGGSGASSSTRGIVTVGGTPGPHNRIEFVTIASTGNATDFGDLTLARRYAQGVSNKTRAVFITGYTGSDTNLIDFVNIATTGNATDFGDRDREDNYGNGATSDSHGGLS